MSKKTWIGIIGMCFATSLLLAVLNPLAYAAEFPTRAVTVIVPYAAGGRSDLANRMLAQYMKPYLGQPVVIENKPGASSVLGNVQVMNSKPDGYTILAGSGGLTTAPYLVETPVTFRDFTPIGRINEDPVIMAINPTKLNVKNLREFIAYAKKNPTEVMMAVDPGMSNEMHALAFAKLAGLEFRYVPYKGGGERIVALSGGHVDAMFDVQVTVKSAVQAGKAKIIGVASAQRVPGLEGVETFKEVGVDLEVGSWNGWLVHKNTPPAIAKVLEIALEKTVKDPEFVKALANVDSVASYQNPEEFFKYLSAEDQFLKKMTEALGIKPKKL